MLLWTVLIVGPVRLCDSCHHHLSLFTQTFKVSTFTTAVQRWMLSFLMCYRFSIFNRARTAYYREPRQYDNTVNLEVASSLIEIMHLSCCQTATKQQNLSVSFLLGNVILLAMINGAFSGQADTSSITCTNTLRSRFPTNFRKRCQRARAGHCPSFC